MPTPTPSLGQAEPARVRLGAKTKVTKLDPSPPVKATDDAAESVFPGCSSALLQVLARSPAARSCRLPVLPQALPLPASAGPTRCPSPTTPSALTGIQSCRVMQSPSPLLVQEPLPGLEHPPQTFQRTRLPEDTIVSKVLPD